MTSLPTLAPSAAPSFTTPAAPALETLEPTAGAEKDGDRRRAFPWIGALAALLLLAFGIAWLGTGPDDEPTPALAESTVPDPVPSPSTPEPAEPEPEPEPPPEPPQPEIDPVELEPDPAELEPEPEPEPEPRKRRRRSRKRKAEPEPEPEPEPDPEPVAPPPRPKPPSAKELLRRAQVALGRGDAREAYDLASRSNRSKSSEAALTLMTRAACRQGSEAKAKQAFKQVPLVRRGPLRRECRQLGVRVGL